MALIAGSKSTYSEPIGTGGNREDLSDVLYDISPTETPFVSMAKKGKADAVKHEWLTDSLTAPAKNAQLEGNVAVAVKPGDRVRLGNDDNIPELLEFYMGKNTPDRQNFVRANLRNEVV